MKSNGDMTVDMSLTSYENVNVAGKEGNKGNAP
jgi:hypothetical protein